MYIITASLVLFATRKIQEIDAGFQFTNIRNGDVVRGTAYNALPWDSGDLDIQDGEIRPVVPLWTQVEDSEFNFCDPSSYTNKAKGMFDQMLRTQFNRSPTDVPIRWVAYLDS